MQEEIVRDDDGTIYIADCSNDRIVKWKPNATEGGHRKGNQFNCLSDVIIDRDNRRVIRWSRQNKIEEEIVILDIDSSRLPMDKKGSLFVSDRNK